MKKNNLRLFLLAALAFVSQAIAQDAYLPGVGSPPAGIEVPAGRVILCIGMSQAVWTCTNRITNGWIQDAGAGLPPIVNGARSGWHTRKIQADPNGYWSGVEQLIRQAGYTNADVGVIWGINATHVLANCPAPCDATSETAALQSHLEAIQDEAEARFPNLVAGFHTSRMNGTWCIANPEPIARETYQAIAGAVQDETIWHVGPYIWAGTSSQPRADGHYWIESDFVFPPEKGPGCHPSAAGVNKVVPMLNAFFSELEYDGTPPPPPADGATNLSAVFAGAGTFILSWTNNGSALICNGATVKATVGESVSLSLPAELAFDIQHSCQVDQSNAVTIGCRDSENCRVF